jgi:hypothetical protein
MTKQIVGTLLRSPPGLFSNEHDAAIGECLLLCEGMRVVIPSGLDELRQDVLPASISFSDHASATKEWPQCRGSLSVSLSEITHPPWEMVEAEG